MNSLRAPENGEVMKLGPPAAGEVIVTVDPSAAGTTFAAGTQTFLPGAQMPVHKHLDRDIVLLVYKGQGRVTLNERIINVVPGAMLHVPKGAWHGVRNTGTGAFQIAWVSSPGLEAFFRDLSHLGDAPSGLALQELAQRHRIEFRQPADASMPAVRHRHQRRRGRPRPPAAPSTPSSIAGAPAAPAPVASSTAGAPRPQRHKRGGGRPLGDRPRGPRSTPPPAARHRRFRRGTEVYMHGQWVRTEGDGPAIAGPKRPGRTAKPDGDEDAPGSSLSVLL